jgi:shikimate kinase
MTEMKNLVLIGMPGSGKSTVGVILAKAMTRPYLDSDILIQLSEKRSLQDIIDSDGYMVLRRIEEQILLGIRCENHVIATGGSAAYSEKAMCHLKKNGIIIFLDASLDTLRARIHNYETRGLAKRPEQSFDDLFQERFNLYTKYADIVINSNNSTQDQVCDDIYLKLQPLLKG